MNGALFRPGFLLASATICAVAVAGCSSGSDGQRPSVSSNDHMPTSVVRSGHSSSSGSSGTDHRHRGPVPAGMAKATHPKYPAGTNVILTADHMPGMKGADATVVGVYDTFTYAVTYTPTTGGPPVKDHKWVVQQEIKGGGTKRLPAGTEVILTADHMPGMDGAHARIVGSTAEPVYVVDYTAGGKTVLNHKWVVQDEIKPAR